MGHREIAIWVRPTVSGTRCRVYVLCKTQTIAVLLLTSQRVGLWMRLLLLFIMKS